MKNYVELAQVTNTINYKEGMGRLLLANILIHVIDAGGALDALKKYQFYHRETDETDGLLEEQAHRAIYDTEDYTDVIDFEVLFPGIEREKALKIYHGIIGIITESVELAEMLRDSLVEQKPVDLTNLIEEVGDQQWYHASIADGLGVTEFSPFQVANIAKLQKRFGGKFDLWKAQQENRPLAEERKILEAADGSWKVEAKGDVTMLTLDPPTAEEERILDDPEFGGTLADLREIPGSRIKGLRIELSGPSGCGKGFAGDKIRELFPQATVVEADLNEKTEQSGQTMAEVREEIRAGLANGTLSIS